MEWRCPSSYEIVCKTKAYRHIAEQNEQNVVALYTGWKIGFFLWHEFNTGVMRKSPTMSNIGDVIQTIIKPTTIRTKLRGDILLNEPLVMIKIRKIIMHGDNVLPTDAHGDKKRIIAVSINEKIHVFKFNHHHMITQHKCMIKRVNGPTHADEHTSCRTTTDKTINKHACMGSLWLALNKPNTLYRWSSKSPQRLKAVQLPATD